MGNKAVKMCEEAKINGVKTNIVSTIHIACTITLFEAEVPEKIIQEHTGYKSRDGFLIIWKSDRNAAQKSI